MIEPLYAEEDYLDEVEELEDLDDDDLDDEAVEELEALVEDLSEEEDDNDYEVAERRRRRSRRRRARPRFVRRRIVSRPSSGLNAIKRSLNKVNRRLAGVSGQLKRHAKVNRRQTRKITALRDYMESRQQTELLMNLLLGTKKFKVESTAGDFPEPGSEIKVKEGAELIDFLLPRFLTPPPPDLGQKRQAGLFGSGSSLEPLLLLKLFSED